MRRDRTPSLLKSTILKHTHFCRLKGKIYFIWVFSSIMLSGLLVPEPLLADTIHLKDGNVVTGNITSRDADFIELETKYGILKVKNDEVLRLDSQTPTSSNTPKPTEASSSVAQQKFAVGVAYTGGSLRYDFDSERAWELRYLVGKEPNEDGDVSSDVIGLRGYRRLTSLAAYNFFTGSELAYFTGKQAGTSYAASGVALGVFGGMEWSISKNISIGVDIGPYMFWMREGESGKNASSLEFVANTFLNFYIF